MRFVANRLVRTTLPALLLLGMWVGRAPAVSDSDLSLAGPAHGMGLAVPGTLNPRGPARRAGAALRMEFALAEDEARLAAVQEHRTLDALRADLRLHAVGTQLYTAWNQPVTLKAINWYGFEYRPFVPDGLDRVPLDTILASVRRLGFNALRLTFADETVETNPVVTQGVEANPALRGLHTLDVMQRIIERARVFGLRVVLCNSRSEAGRGPELSSGMWYTARYPESSWMADWETLVTRFRNQSAFVGADLRNEPHITGASFGEQAYFNNGPLWGAYHGTYYHQRDWHYAAQTLGNALLQIDPRLLIIVEGVQMYLSPDGNQLSGALWGSNLIGVQYDPIVLSRPGQLVYSVHEYGPQMWQASWFNPNTTYQDLADHWTSLWGYLLAAPKYMQAPIFVGEFGTCHEYFTCTASSQGWKQGFWFQSFVRYLREHPEVGWAYWALNPTGPFHPDEIHSYSLVSPDWRHYYPLTVQGLAPLLAEPDGLWHGYGAAAVARVKTFTPQPGCGAGRSCVARVAAAGAASARPVPAGSLTLMAGVPYIQPADAFRRGDLYLPQNAAARRPAVVLVHGPTWSSGRRGAATAGLARVLAWHGYVVFDIDYRLTGQGGGFPHDVQDVKDAVAFLATNAAPLRIDPARIGIAGSGAGGYLAMMAAYTPGQPELRAPHYPHTTARPAVVASFFGDADLQDLAGWTHDGAILQGLQGYLGASLEQRADLYTRASPYTYVGTAVPTIFFGGVDDRIRFDDAFWLYAALRQRSVESQLIDLPGAPRSIAALRGRERNTVLTQLTNFLDGVLCAPRS